MPDADLIAWLDGEADPVTAREIEARLQTDADLRAELLRLMRQRVALTRVLGHVAPIALPARTSHGRWWLVAAAGVAASIVLAVLLAWPSTPPPVPSPVVRDELPRPSPTQSERPPSPPPTPSLTRPDHPAEPVPDAPYRLSDGTRLSPGSVFEAARDQALDQRLDDGTVLVLAAGSAIEVPAAGQPWLLRRGSAVVDLLSSTRVVHDGVATGEVVVTGAGRIQMTMSEDGTLLRLLTGDALARDVVTATSMRLRAGPEWWIPADMAAPREEEGQNGITRGTVVEVQDKGRAIALRTRFGTFLFRPEWLTKPPGFDQAMVARLASLQPGDRVVITWRMSEHLRVLAVQVLAPARTLPEDGLKPSANDF